MDIFSKIDKLAEKEDSFLKDEFLSPVINQTPVRVKIGGVVLHMSITRPKKFEGWGVFKPIDFKSARKVRNANDIEKRRYLDLFPALRLVLCSKQGDQWLGVPANHSDTRFRIQGLVPVRLAEEVQMLDLVCTRFDGSNCWFDEVEIRQNPKNTVLLRESLQNLVEPKTLQFSGLTKEDRDAYTYAYLNELENRKDLQEERIKDAIRRAGGEYRSYIERGKYYTVEYSVDGANYRSLVDKETLSVETAGICLTDHNTGRVGDKDFDLQSLVGVIREGQRRHRIHRYGV